jgi:hypothetical protein
MNRQTKLNSQEQQEAQQESVGEQAQQTAAAEFATPEELLRHDALRTPVPPTIAHRLQESIGKSSPRPRSWWQRLFSGSNK